VRKVIAAAMTTEYPPVQGPPAEPPLPEAIFTLAASKPAPSHLSRTAHRAIQRFRPHQPAVTAASDGLRLWPQVPPGRPAVIRGALVTAGLRHSKSLTGEPFGVLTIFKGGGYSSGDGLRAAVS
jgi:hypothetical protein